MTIHAVLSSPSFDINPLPETPKQTKTGAIHPLTVLCKKVIEEVLYKTGPKFEHPKAWTIYTQIEKFVERKLDFTCHFKEIGIDFFGPFSSENKRILAISYISKRAPLQILNYFRPLEREPFLITLFKRHNPSKKELNARLIELLQNLNTITIPLSSKTEKPQHTLLEALLNQRDSVIENALSIAAKHPDCFDIVKYILPYFSGRDIHAALLSVQKQKSETLEPMVNLLTDSLYKKKHEKTAELKPKDPIINKAEEDFELTASLILSILGNNPLQFLNQEKPFLLTFISYFSSESERHPYLIDLLEGFYSTWANKKDQSMLSILHCLVEETTYTDTHALIFAINSFNSKPSITSFVLFDVLARTSHPDDVRAAFEISLTKSYAVKPDDLLSHLSKRDLLKRNVSGKTIVEYVIDCNKQQLLADIIIKSPELFNAELIIQDAINTKDSTTLLKLIEMLPKKVLLQKNSSGRTIAHLATRCTNFSVFLFLMKKCPELFNEYSYSILIEAIRLDDEYIATMLIAILSTAQLLQTGSEGETIAHFAASHGHINILSSLLKKCPEIFNLKTKRGHIPITAALSHNQEKTAIFILSSLIKKPVESAELLRWIAHNIPLDSFSDSDKRAIINCLIFAKTADELFAVNLDDMTALHYSITTVNQALGDSLLKALESYPHHILNKLPLIHLQTTAKTSFLNANAADTKDWLEKSEARLCSLVSRVYTTPSDEKTDYLEELLRQLNLDVSDYT